ncbi:flavodoxin [Desulfosarcina ovata subsp. sediminis]|uniref:Flavodoxin n=1 Tax=Desulfosarcina ovata subsp. sediminis TaxID=885957 RepID=A0A5K7ZDN4_9BACT|nr:flavin reductase family protein [Desulfosarcina ovata]BBO80112.1 flavodoxin [Desulfosarcina ovata subsp. sediminis]
MVKKFCLGPEALLFPTPSVLVGTVVDGRPNFMTAAWCGIASSKPPAISVAVRGERHTLKGILANGEFSINVPAAGMAADVDFCGIYSGRKVDKSTVFELFNGDLANAPLVADCPVNLECRLRHTLDLGAHTLVVGEVIQTHVTESCLTDGKPDAVKIDPLVYSPGSGYYQRLGEIVGKAFSIGKKKDKGA